MAKLENLQNALTKPQPTGQDLASLVKRVDVVKRFEEVLGKNAPSFIASILSLHNASPQLQRCNPRSILSSAMIAATLKLPINQSLGFAAIVPYGDQAQFQVMTKGLRQLAIRTGLYDTMTTEPVHEGELIEYNRIESTFVIDEKKRKSDKIIGWVSYFRLKTGFRKYLYMTVEQIHAHARKFSKTYSHPNGSWQKHKETMEEKTVSKMLISKYGPMSVEIQESGVVDDSLAKAIEYDQAVVVEAETGETVPTYPDNATDETPAGDAQEPVPGDLPLK